MIEIILYLLLLVINFKEMNEIKIMETFKDIPWYEWLYQVSDLWNVKSLKRFVNCWPNWYMSKDKILKSNKNIKKWYVSVILSKNWDKKDFNIHRLVAWVFLWLNMDDKKQFACHRNDIRDDNRLENLFIWTASENMQDCKNKWRIGIWNSKLNKIQVKEIKEKYSGGGFTHDAIWRLFWVDRSTITCILAGKTWNYI